MHKIMFWSAIATIGLSWSSIVALQFFHQPQSGSVAQELATAVVSDPLAFLPTGERIAVLPQTQAIYPELLLGELHLQEADFPKALASLSGLEQKYPQLADYVLLKRAQVLTRQGDRANAQKVWQEILAQHAQKPPAAHALRALGREEELIRQFPSHPITRDVLLQMIRRQPQRMELIAQLSFYFPDTPNIVPLLNRLTSSNYPLNPDQWWAIADAYYDNFEFPRAANAYSRATANSFTAYRIGRSWQRARQGDRALTAYENLVQRYPQSPEAPRALIRIIQLGNSSQRVRARDRLLSNYPDTAPEALLLLTQVGDRATADSASQQLLTQFNTSNSAGELRWRIAQEQARRGDVTSAINTVNLIIQQNPQSAILAESAFWAGKWSLRRNDQANANRFFTIALKLQPDSYFAWRSAVMLGWQEVGDFTTMRQVNLSLQPPSGRRPLPAGSPTVNQLYLAGLDRDAWEHWYMELGGKRMLSPRELFTDGILRVGVNDNLRGIRNMESLTWIDVPPDQQREIRELMSLPQFQHTLYPFPYFSQIVKWSNEFSLPPALVIALMRQESRFEPEILSRSGAVGLMQIMPDTGAWIASRRGIRNYSLTNPEDNINFGTWYLDYTHRTFSNNSMLAVASYNAGPGAIGRWLRQRGLGDVDEFINNIPYAETRDYVPKVFGNYWNYLRLYSPVVQKRLQSLALPKG